MSDFPALKVVAEQIISELTEVQHLNLILPLNAVYYDDFHKSVLQIHDDPLFNDPEGDWQTLTVSMGKKPPRIQINNLDPERIERLSEIKMPELPSSGSGVKKNYGESTTKKLESKLAFLQANYEEIAKLAKKIDIDKLELIKSIMTL